MGQCLVIPIARAVTQRLYFNVFWGQTITDCVSFAAGDLMMIKDGGSPFTLTALPTNVNMLGVRQKGSCSVSISAVEADLAHGLINISSNTTPPEYEDTVLILNSKPAYPDGVFVYTLSGHSGTTWPVGTIEHPVDNLADAYDICNAMGVYKITLMRGSGDIDYAGGESMKVSIESDGVGGHAPVVRFQNQAVQNATFTGLVIKAISTGSSNKFYKCYFDYSTTKCGWGSWFYDCVFTTDINAEYDQNFRNCHFFKSGILNLTNLGAGKQIDLFDCHGNITIKNDAAACTVNLYRPSGKITIDASMDQATINIYGGNYDKTDNSAAGCTVNEYAEYTDTQRVNIDSPVPTISAIKTVIDGVSTDVVFLKNARKNLRKYVKVGADYYEVIYDNAGTTPIVNCKLEKYAGGAIGDLSASTTPSTRFKSSV
jgi:hypothetical protein